MVARKSSWDFLHVSKGLKVMSWDQRFFDSIESPVSSPNLRLNFCRFCLIAGPYCRCFIHSPRGISLNLSYLGCDTSRMALLSHIPHLECDAHQYGDCRNSS